jgi:hypothetical protein
MSDDDDEFLSKLACVEMDESIEEEDDHRTIWEYIVKEEKFLES